MDTYRILDQMLAEAQTELQEVQGDVKDEIAASARIETILDAMERLGVETPA